MENMNQFGIQYIYMWKCHNETLCIDVLNKQKFLFFPKMKDRNVNQALTGVGTSGKRGKNKERV
jgi:hypothetical protein